MRGARRNAKSLSKWNRGLQKLADRTLKVMSRDPAECRGQTGFSVRTGRRERDKLVEAMRVFILERSHPSRKDLAASRCLQGRARQA